MAAATAISVLGERRRHLTADEVPTDLGAPIRSCETLCGRTITRREIVVVGGVFNDDVRLDQGDCRGCSDATLRHAVEYRRHP